MGRGRHWVRAQGTGKGSAEGKWLGKNKVCRSVGWLGDVCMEVVVATAE